MHALIFACILIVSVWGDGITSDIDPSLLLTASSISAGASITWAPFDDSQATQQDWAYDQDNGVFYLVSSPNFGIGISLLDLSLVLKSRTQIPIPFGTQVGGIDKWNLVPLESDTFSISSRLLGLIISIFDNKLRSNIGLSSSTYALRWVSISQYIVVGGGTAGGLVAKRLTDPDYDAKVLVLEAGIRRDDNPIFWGTGTLTSVYTDANFNFGFQSERVPGLSGRQLQVAVGRMWGGTSMHNGMLWTRAIPYDYNIWATFGGDTWNYTNNVELLKSFENFTVDSTSSACHGYTGEVDISPQAVFPSQVVGPMIDSFCAYYPGLSEITEENCFEQFGLTKNLQLTMQNFGPNAYRRESASTAFFNSQVVDPTTGKGVGPRKLTIASNAFASKLIFHPTISTKVIGVEYLYNGKKTVAYATKEVIISAGTYNSPALLLRSGIGNCTDLTSKGIPCTFNNPYVGKNFIEHVYVTLAVRIPASTVPYLLPLMAATNTIGRFFEGNLKSSLASQYTDPSISSTVQPDTKVSWSFGAYIDPSTNSVYNISVQYPQSPYPMTSIVTNLMRPKCVGQVNIADGNPSNYPVISPNHMCPDDLPWFRQIYKDLLAIVTNMSQTVDPQYQLVFPPANIINDPTKLDEVIRAVGINSHHPSGTVKMGNFDTIQQGVVSGNLCVHGIQHLRVADASIMPTPGSLNFQSAVYSIGAKAAEFIKVGMGC